MLFAAFTSVALHTPTPKLSTPKIATPTSKIAMSAVATSTVAADVLRSLRELAPAQNAIDWDALQNLLEASGLKHPSELGPEHVVRRVSKTEVHSYMDLFPFLEPGALLEGKTDLTVFDKYWESARADTFEPPEFILKLRETKLR